MRLHRFNVRYRLWHILLLVVLASLVCALMRPVPIEVDFRLTHISVGDNGFPNAWIQITNTSPRDIRYHRDRYTMVESCEGVWHLSGVGNSPGLGVPAENERDTGSSTTVSFVSVLAPGESEMIQVPLRHDCARFVLGVTLSSWRYPKLVEFRSPIFEIPRNVEQMLP